MLSQRFKGLALALSLLVSWPAHANEIATSGQVIRVGNLQSFLQDPNLLSNSGRPLQLIRFEPKTKQFNGARYRFLIQAGLHGNETLTSHFVLWLVQRIRNGESALNTLPEREISIDFLPFANPDGSAEQSRYNANGVNLNRNFDVLWGVTRENPGTQSFSEPETRAIRRLFAERNYTAAIDVHGYINWIVAPSDPATLAARRANFVPTSAQIQNYLSWHSALKRELSQLEGYELKTAGELGDGGAFEDWAFWKTGTLAFCLELESIQRYVLRRSAINLEQQNANGRVDLFKTYELFITRMFQHAIAIKRSDSKATLNLARQP